MFANSQQILESEYPGVQKTVSYKPVLVEEENVEEVLCQFVQTKRQKRSSRNSAR